MRRTREIIRRHQDYRRSKKAGIAAAASARLLPAPLLMTEYAAILARRPGKPDAIDIPTTN